MLEKIIEIIIYIVIGCFTVKIGYKNYKMYKEAEDSIEKVIYMIATMIIGTPYIIYILDRYNIPSRFGYINNINTSDWLNFIGSYSSAIITSILSAIFLVIVTKQQIERTYKDNVTLNKESYRIQNLPYLQYELLYDIENSMDFVKTKWIMIGNQEQYVPIEFSISMKNIGLNSIRKIYMKVNSEMMKSDEIVELYNQGCIEQGKNKKKDFVITGLAKGDYIFWITIYYQDLMKNWYEQKIRLDLHVTNIHDIKRKCFGNITVFDEKQIDKLPKIVNKYEENKEIGEK